ncbi:ubl carboxyl-terminal hydrolase 18 isoform X2 [Mixophyes fleayi]|uniref:ubl carboxyl-terminal hydrolase 18 isoform X2 n=1 Tax=Mixophyes fleayi TaxID=3061075 RepID=UPI003F4E1451
MYEDGYIDLRVVEVEESQEDVCGAPTPNKCLSYSTGRFKNGAIGLCNIGFTGCLNPLLQTLYMNKEFTDILCEIGDPDDNLSPEKRLPYELLKLFEEMQNSKEDSVPPYRLLRCLQPLSVTLFAQNDVAEVFSTLLNLLLQNISNPRLEERLRSLYSVSLEERFTCQRCFQQRSKHNDLLSITISVPHSKYQRKLTLEHALWKYFKCREVNEDESICPKCERSGRASKVTQLRSLPRTLNIHLRRLGKRNGSRLQKINRTLSFPPVLDLLEVLDLDHLPEGEHPTSHYNYRLFAVIAHSGTASVGYFSTYISCSKNGAWCFFNDSSVCKINQSHHSEQTLCLTADLRGGVPGWKQDY